VVYVKPKQPIIKDCARRFVLKLYSHEASRGLFATAELLVCVCHRCYFSFGVWEINEHLCLCEGNALTYHMYQKFSTFDRDNDNCGACNCAKKYKAGWWYNGCSESNLNGLYLRDYRNKTTVGIEWEPFKGYDYSLKATEMKIRPLYSWIRSSGLSLQRLGNNNLKHFSK